LVIKPKIWYTIHGKEIQTTKLHSKHEILTILFQNNSNLENKVYSCCSELTATPGNEWNFNVMLSYEKVAYVYAKENTIQYSMASFSLFINFEEGKNEQNRKILRKRV